MIRRAKIVLGFSGAIYLGLAALPTSAFWYRPGEVRFKDAVLGTAPEVVFSRDILHSTGIKYATVTRKEGGDTDCEGRGGPFPYQPFRGPLLGKDLVWWSAGDERCRNLPVGTYWTDTCWTVVRPAEVFLPGFLKGPLGWLLPPKEVCRPSPPFEITEP